MKKRPLYMYRRIWIILTAALLLSLLLAVYVNIFGVRAFWIKSAPLTCPAATISPSGGLRAFHLVPQKSEASYQVHAQAFGQGIPDSVVGTTTKLTGAFLLTSNYHPTITSLKIIVNLWALTSGQDQRDEDLHGKYLESNTYPCATFTSTNVQIQPGSYNEGKEVAFSILGNMIIHNVTRPVTFTVHAKLVGNAVTGTAQSLIHMQDFGVEPPSAVIAVNIKNEVTITLHFTAQLKN